MFCKDSLCWIMYFERVFLLCEVLDRTFVELIGLFIRGVLKTDLSIKLSSFDCGIILFYLGSCLSLKRGSRFSNCS